MAIHWEVARTRVALHGRATDAASGAALPRVRVEITAGPPAFTAAQALRARQHGAAWAAADLRPGRTRTAADGSYHFEDLPPGDYTLAFSRPEDGTRRGSAVVNATVPAPDADPPRAVASASLVPTTLKGRVTGTGGAAVAMAEVRLWGSGERAYTDADGRWSLPAVEVGAREVRVAARGYAPFSAPATLATPGASATVDAVLTAA